MKFVNLHTQDDMLLFFNKYDKLAPKGKLKSENLKRFVRIGFNEMKFKIHLSLNRKYFLTAVSDEVEYYKAYLRLVPKAGLDFYTMGYYQTEDCTQYGYTRVRVPDNIMTNFYRAKREVREESICY